MVYNAVDGGVKVVKINSTTLELEVKDFYQDYVLGPDYDPSCLEPNQGDILSFPHSSSYLDLDSDCIADIFMTKEKPGVSGDGKYYYEFYTNRLIGETQKFCLVQKDDLPTNIDGSLPLFGFADFDRDAMADMIYYADGTINILFNRLDAPDAGSSNLCSTPVPLETLSENALFTPLFDQNADIEFTYKQSIVISGSTI